MRSAHRRRSIRLPGYDYTQPGGYFVTICTKDQGRVLGEVADGQVGLTALGQVASQCLADLPAHFPAVELDEWVVMPNHIHVILILRSPGGGVQLNAPTVRTGSQNHTEGRAFPRLSPGKGTLAVVVRTYKAAVTTLARREHLAEGVWQRNYYEHVIRSGAELRRIREYIALNPLAWERDEENRDRT
jgi:putative transposase